MKVNVVALDKLIHWKIRLAYPRTNNSGALGLTGNQLTDDAWLMEMTLIFNVRRLTKNSARIIDFLGENNWRKYLVLKYPENLGEKNVSRIYVFRILNRISN